MQIFFLFASNSRFRCLSIIFVPCFFFFLSLFWFLLKTVSMLDPRQTLFLSFFFCESVQYFFLLLLSAKHWFMLQTLNSWNIRRRMNVDCGKLEFFFQRQEVDAGQVWPGQVVCMCAGHFISTILCINELTNYRLPRKWTLISVWYSELQNKKNLILHPSVRSTKCLQLQACVPLTALRIAVAEYYISYYIGFWRKLKGIVTWNAISFSILSFLISSLFSSNVKPISCGY